MKTKSLLIGILMLSVCSFAQHNTETYVEQSYGKGNNGSLITIKFEKGKEHNHPLFAIWLADENGKYIQTLYVSQSIGKGIFRHVNHDSYKHWESGEIQRPAALPYWAHQRNIKNEFGTFNPTPRQPVVDAYTGATPSSSFILKCETEKKLRGKYKIMLELNQSWDWNEYWTNDKFPNDKEYKTSSQPALVYSVDIDLNNLAPEYLMKPIGHSHYSGANGELDSDLSTITTALQIAKSISVKID